MKRIAIAMILIILMMTANNDAVAGNEQTTGTTPSIDQFLAPDGRLDVEALKRSRYQGPLDFDGYELRLDAETGAPAFRSLTDMNVDPDDVFWSDQYRLNGIDGEVYAVCWAGDDLYVGGSFTRADEVEAHNLTIWTPGGQWIPYELGGTNGPIYAIWSDGDGGQPYIGGDFTTLGNDTVNYAAHLTGGQDALHLGLNGPVYAITANAGTPWLVIFGGSFSGAVGRRIFLPNLAIWNSDDQPELAWGHFPHHLDTYGTDGPIHALKVFGDSMLVAGGDFTYAYGAGGNHTDSIVANNICRFKTVGEVGAAPLGNGTNGPVYALATVPTGGGAPDAITIVAGGAFSVVDGINVGNIAGWDGTEWSNLGGGFDGTVRALTPHAGGILAGGDFTQAVIGGDVNHVALFDGAGWIPLGNGTNAPVYSAAYYDWDNFLAIGGSFTQVGDVGANGVASWDGSEWTGSYPLPVGLGANGYVLAAVEFGSDLIVAGTFTEIGGVAANHIATFDGTDWMPMGEGMNGHVYALDIYNGDLIAGGYFTEAGGTAALRIASWNGADWSSLGSGVNSTVRALTVYGGGLVAAGYFTQAGGSSANRIAAWNGLNWSPVGPGLSGAVQALTVLGTELVAGGAFSEAGGSSANNIAVWNDVSWSPLGAGTNGTVHALTVYGQSLIAGGTFTNPGPNGVALWAGSVWSSVGGQLLGDVVTLDVHNNNVYAGGWFSDAGHIRMWNDTTWTRLGSGTNGFVAAMTTYVGNLIVGGGFHNAGAKASSYLGRWDKGVAVVSTDPPANQLNVPGATSISIVFDEEMNPATLNSSTIVVNAASSGPHTGIIVYDNASKTASFNPDVAFELGENITVQLTSDIGAIDGEKLAESYSWSFTVVVENGSGNFLLDSAYLVGTEATGTVAADFNDDGHLDIASTDSQGEVVTVFLNNGSGKFVAQAPVGSAGTYPIALCAADLDNDGYLDLITANRESSNLTVLTNQGNGSFSFAANYATGLFPTAVSSADLDGDGTLDLVTSNSGSDDVSVLLNNGVGTMLPAVNYPTGSAPMAVAVADLTGNNHPDLVTANTGSNDMTLLVNRGNGTFIIMATYPIGGTQPVGLIVVDLDGDEDLDVATANNGSDDLTMLLNSGYGAFVLDSVYPVGSAPTSIWASDLDGDTDIDLAVANRGSSSVTTLLNNGLGGFDTGLGFSVDGDPRSVAAADFDDDGDLDLACANGLSSTVSIHMNLNIDCCVRRGDVNHDGASAIDISDLVYLIDFMFRQGPSPLCPHEADINGDGQIVVDISDLLYLIDYMFVSGPEPVVCP